MTTDSDFDDGDLVLRRTFSTGVDDVWAAVTESERLARWYGTWTGDPATGSVMVTMNSEADAVAPVRYDITECVPPQLLSVVIGGDDDMGWALTVELTEYDGITTLTFVQRNVDRDALGNLRPGWEWYFDRLAASLDGTTMPSLDEFESTYLGD